MLPPRAQSGHEGWSRFICHQHTAEATYDRRLLTHDWLYPVRRWGLQRLQKPSALRCLLLTTFVLGHWHPVKLNPALVYKGTIQNIKGRAPYSTLYFVTAVQSSHFYLFSKIELSIDSNWCSASKIAAASSVVLCACNSFYLVRPAPDYWCCQVLLDCSICGGKKHWFEWGPKPCSRPSNTSYISVLIL